MHIIGIQWLYLDIGDHTVVRPVGVAGGPGREGGGLRVHSSRRKGGRWIIGKLTLIVLGGGEGRKNTSFDLFWKQCPCLHNNKTTLTRKISLFDTALLMTNT